MSRRLFRKLLPRRSGQLSNTRIGRLVEKVMGPVLGNRRLWQLNRKSVARGVACGTFWAFIPLPIQTIGALMSSISLRGNIPVAMLFTWISNPITWVPIFYAGYRVGLAVTGQPEAIGLAAEIERLANEGVVEGTKGLFAYFADNLNRVIPLIIGCGMLGTLAAGTGYWGVKMLWRFGIVRRWKYRGHHVQCPHCRHLVLGGDDQPTVDVKLCPACQKQIPLYRRIGLGLGALHRKFHPGDPRVALQSLAARARKSFPKSSSSASDKTAPHSPS
ncbi:MAG: DUF2062 domain-containing protein [Planctomycetota bacterium]